jgi:ribosomal protein S18 acetylase RimI-like enzyme
MSRLELAPFADEHLEDAARLLAARHGRHRALEPLLDERYEDPAEVLPKLEHLWSDEGMSGSAALRRDRLVGYVIGAPRPSEVWGPNIWVELPGHAVEDAEDARDLYGHAAARWVEEGNTRHYALVPPDPSLVDAWFRVGFGQQQAHGYREVPEGVEVRVPEGCEIRELTEADIDELIAAGIDLALPRHQQASPVFSMRPLPTEEEIRNEWADTIEQGEEHVLLGYRDGRPVACWAFVRADLSIHFRGLALPDRACYLGYAVTLPESRGTGLGVALTETGFGWAAQQGYGALVTDWRVTNLLASRFWPRRGFRSSVLRLYRSIP